MFVRLLSFGGSLGPKCVSLNNPPCQARPKLVDANSNEPFYCPFTLSLFKCGGSWNTIDDPYTRIYIPHKVKNINVKVFIIMSEVNKTV